MSSLILAEPEPGLEKTLVIAKPEALKRGIVNKILESAEEENLNVRLARSFQFNEQAIREFYEHVFRKFGEATLASYSLQMSAPSVAFIIEGHECIKKMRDRIGDTQPLKAKPGTIRGDFSSIGTDYVNKHGIPYANLVHGSDGDEAFQREMGILLKYGWISDADYYKFRHPPERHSAVAHPIPSPKYERVQQTLVLLGPETIGDDRDIHKVVARLEDFGAAIPLWQSFKFTEQALIEFYPHLFDRGTAKQVALHLEYQHIALIVEAPGAVIVARKHIDNYGDGLLRRRSQPQKDTIINYVHASEDEHEVRRDIDILVAHNLISASSYIPYERFGWKELGFVKKN